MKKIFHCGDLHLGSTSQLIPNLLSEQLNVLEDISKKAVDETVSAIVIAGDLFNSPHISETIIKSFLNILKKNGNLNYIITSGTHGHDSYENENSIFKRTLFASPPANCYLLDKIENGYILLDGIAYYSSKHKLQSKAVADHHILIYHGTVNELNDYLAKSAIKKYDYIAFGHYHYNEIFKTSNMIASYCGTLLAFEWPKGKNGINESTYSKLTFNNTEINVEKMISSDVKFIRSFISRSEDLNKLELKISGKSLLKLWGKEQFESDAKKRFEQKVAYLEFEKIQLKDIPAVIISSIDAIIAGQNDNELPWEDVREAALKLISGEEGKDLLSPEKHINSLFAGN